MWLAVTRGVLALVIATQVGTQACDRDEQTPGPTTGETLSTSDGVRFQIEVVATGLEIPWSMAFAPDGRLFLTERPGRVRIINLTGRNSELALTLEDVFAQGEAGLLGLALDPEFAQNRFVYLYYTSRQTGSIAVNRVVRYRETASRLTDRVLLLDNIPAATIHDGGRIRFGPDGLLYITTGDAANTSLAQDVASLAGKILRINKDATTPRTNPFGSPVFSFGHRNPQGLDWHPATGDLWASEHGNVNNDEINVIDAGANYGWPRIEAGQSMPGMRTPVAFYNPAIAPSGASFYRGQRFPRFENNLFVATLRGMHLLRLVISGRAITAQERLLENRFGRLRDVIVGPDGFLYFCTNNRDGRGTPSTEDDRILRLVPVT
jgi:glucose/arabinose dehydrogenase